MQDTMNSTISNSLQLFQNTDWKIRVVMRDGDPWFVASDVCKCLDLGNPSQAIARLEDDERWLISNEALRANGETAVVSEPGLYSLVLGSRKPEATSLRYETSGFFSLHGAVFDTPSHLCYKSQLSRWTRGQKTERPQKVERTP